MCQNRPVAPMVIMPSNSANLNACLKNILAGFVQIKNACPKPPIAISAAFSGFADYPNGVVEDLPNLPAFRGAVALGPMLEDEFNIPVFINNDGDLFTYGEASAGFLPYINGLLGKSGSPKRYKNLFGFTVGIRFGGGIVRNGELFTGDNSGAADIWFLKNKRLPLTNSEGHLSIRSLRDMYAREAGIPISEAPTPTQIGAIAFGTAQGNQEAAIEAYNRLGEVLGETIGNAFTPIDGLAVIGGGLSKAHQLFFPAIMKALGGFYLDSNGNKIQRLISKAFNLNDNAELGKFLHGETREIAVPGSDRTIKYDPLRRTGVGISQLGTRKAIAIGAYAFALKKLS
jgi:glucokinase